ncbi:MAG: hypothetical protein ABIF08_00315 [Nanoarchaeota archaeon]
MLKLFRKKPQTIERKVDGRTLIEVHATPDRVLYENSFIESGCVGYRSRLFDCYLNDNVAVGSEVMADGYFRAGNNVAFDHSFTAPDNSVFGDYCRLFPATKVGNNVKFGKEPDFIDDPEHGKNCIVKCELYRFLDDGVFDPKEVFSEEGKEFVWLDLDYFLSVYHHILTEMYRTEAVSR